MLDVDAKMSSRAGVVITPGASHFDIFRRISNQLAASGNDIPDAFVAAYALEQNATMVSNDRGFRRFDGSKVLLPRDL